MWRGPRGPRCYRKGGVMEGVWPTVIGTVLGFCLGLFGTVVRDRIQDNKRKRAIATGWLNLTTCSVNWR